jgi:hypothetical protein
MTISPNEVWKLPHSHFLRYRKALVTEELQQSEQGQDILDKFNRYMNPRTEPDIDAIRAFSGHRQVEKEKGD